MKELIKTIVSKSVRSSLRRLQNRLKLDPTENNEGAIIRSLLRPDDVQFLVDIGAHDGKLYSNSYQLISSGWGGILVEPLPKPFQTLSTRYKEKKNVTCVNQAVSNSVGKGQFFIGADGDSGMTSTLCQDENPWYAANRTQSTIDVSINTLTNILHENNAPEKFPLLFIDAEGMDYEVLQGLDFDRFRPRVILTENYAPKLPAKEQLLSSKGYWVHINTGGNSFWLCQG